MELGTEGFVAVNVPSTFEEPVDVLEYFSLEAAPNTAIWRKPSASDDTTAPMVLKRLERSFLIAEVTVSAELSEEFDQAGIVIFAGSALDPTLSPLPIAARRVPRYRTREGHSRPMGRWAKAGLQLVERQIHVASVVASSPYGADWTSSARLTPPQCAHRPYSMTSKTIRVKLERLGESLWIWYKLADNLSSSCTDHPVEDQCPEDVASGWKKMREIMGFFSGELDLLKEVWVGCYASRPMEFEPRHSWDAPCNLLADFEEFSIF